MRRYPSNSQLIPVASLLNFPPAWPPALHAAVLGSEESLARGREEAVSTKTMGIRRKQRALAEHLKAYRVKENATTSLGNPSEEMRRLQFSPALAEEGILMPFHLLHIRRRQQALPGPHSAWILEDSGRNTASQQAFVKSLSQLS